MREWRNRQTRTVQVRVLERVWGFNSPLAHTQERPWANDPGAFLTFVLKLVRNRAGE